MLRRCCGCLLGDWLGQVFTRSATIGKGFPLSFPSSWTQYTWFRCISSGGLCNSLGGSVESSGENRSFSRCSA